MYKYEDELYEAQKDFNDFHRVYDKDIAPCMLGMRKSTSWANNPKNCLDEASQKMQSITSEGLNVYFYKNYFFEFLYSKVLIIWWSKFICRTQ